MLCVEGIRGFLEQQSLALHCLLKRLWGRRKERKRMGEDVRRSECWQKDKE